MCVLHFSISHSIIGAIESCSAFYENTLEALLRCFSFPESFFFSFDMKPTKTVGRKQQVCAKECPLFSLCEAAKKR